MASQSLGELKEFHDFLGEKLKNGEHDASPEEALDEWRHAHPDDSGAQVELQAIQEALDDMAHGDRGIPFEDFDQEFRKRRAQDLPVE